MLFGHDRCKCFMQRLRMLRPARVGSHLRLCQKKSPAETGLRRAIEEAYRTNPSLILPDHGLMTAPALLRKIG